jgi:hypothetical protein
MRKKIGIVLVTVLALMGLSAITAPQAGASVAVGTYNLLAECDKAGILGDNATAVSINYTVTYLGYSEGINANRYSFELNKATYDPRSYGLGLGNNSVNATVQYANLPSQHNLSELWLRATGTAEATLFPTGASSSVPTVRTNNVGGVNWDPVTITQSVNNGNNRLRLAWDSSTAYPCEVLFDLGQPQAPLTGSNPNGGVNFICEDTGDILDLSYVLSASTVHPGMYDFRVTSVDYENENFNAPDSIKLRVSDDGFDITSSADITSGSSNWTSGALTFVEEHGVNGVSFPQVELQPVVGEQLMPIIGFSVFRNGETETADCSDSWNLGIQFPDQHGATVPDATHVEDYNFDDCDPATSNTKVDLTVDWSYDWNKQYIRPSRFTIKNTSSARLVLPAATSSYDGGLSYKYNGDAISGLGNLAPLSYRTINPGATLTVDIFSAGNWQKRNNAAGNIWVTDNPAPYTQRTPRDMNPKFELFPQVFTLNHSTNRCTSGEIDLAYSQISSPI